MIEVSGIKLSLDAGLGIVAEIRSAACGKQEKHAKSRLPFKRLRVS